MGFSRQEYWSGLPFPLLGDLPDLGIEPASPVSPALAGGFFTNSATWEAHRWSDLMANALFTLWRYMLKVYLKELATVFLRSKTQVPGEVMWLPVEIRVSDISPRRKQALNSDVGPKWTTRVGAWNCRLIFGNAVSYTGSSTWPALKSAATSFIYLQKMLMPL